MWPVHQARSISEAVVDTALLERQAAERAAEDAASEYKAGRHPFGLFESHHDPIIQYHLCSYTCIGMLMQHASARIRLKCFVLVVGLIWNFKLPGLFLSLCMSGVA